MVDIVERLRKLPKVADCNQAADEIERLRAELQLAHSEIAMMNTAKADEEPF